MCLISKWRFAKRAKEDIECYKILKEVSIPSLGLTRYKTPYQGDIVDINKPFKATGLSWSFFSKEKRGGYIHAFSNIYDAKDLHVKDGVLFRCIIPKGTKYHISKWGSTYCSKKIIFIEKV